MSASTYYGISPLEYAVDDDPPEVINVDVKAFVNAVVAVGDELSNSLLPDLTARANREGRDRGQAVLDADAKIMRGLQLEGWEKLRLMPAGESRLEEIFRIEDAWDRCICQEWQDAEDRRPSRFFASAAGLPAGFALYCGVSTDINSAGRWPEDARLLNNMMFFPTQELLGWGVHTLKNRFQRPRPFQLFYPSKPKSSFFHLLSNTAHSPAFPAGHSVQATAAAISCQNRMQGDPKWTAHIAKLSHWADSVALRRNQAGLHFPSDNLAAWIYLAATLRVLFPSEAKAAVSFLRTQILDSHLAKTMRANKTFDDAFAVLDDKLSAEYV